MTATERAEPAGPTTLWGVGSYHDGMARVTWEISHDEMRADMGRAATVLRALRVGTGDRVLFCSMLSEAGQFWPLVVGAMLAGAQLSCADANEGDAVRVAMFTRLMEYRAVVGVTPSLLDGLDLLGRPYDEVFGGVEVVAARPGAYARLRASGLAPYRFALCGPAVAVADAPDAPARVDERAWRLDVDPVDGRILVTSLTPRAMRFERAATAVRGVLTHDGGLVPREE